MGGSSSSSSTTDIYTSNIVNALSKTIQNCQGNTIIDQKVQIIGNYNVVKKVRLVQGLKLSSSCALDDKNIATAQQAVENAIKQQTESQNVALLGALTNTSSDNNLKIHNEVQATITRETIQNIVNNFNATQEFYLNGNNNIVEDITMEQSMKVLFEGCLQALSQLSSVQEVKNNAEQIAKSTQTNFIAEIVDSFSNLFKGLGMLWVIIIVCGLVVGGYVIVNSGGLGNVIGMFIPEDESPTYKNTDHNSNKKVNS